MATWLAVSSMVDGRRHLLQGPPSANNVYGAMTTEGALIADTAGDITAAAAASSASIVELDAEAAGAVDASFVSGLCGGACPKGPKYPATPCLNVSGTPFAASDYK